jgi:hypothetical protein|tara:strand:+ start:15960 stop:16475 length:516 start_codon:yes stop_codon:yes gene_type:complete
MKKFFEKLSPYLIRFGERGLSIAAFIFPFVEVVSYFGPKVFLNTDSVALRMFYSTYIEKLSRFYTDNNLLIFIFMVWVFIVCARGSVPLTKYVRYNVIQAILLNIVCSCSGVVFTFLPIVLRESMVGVIFANFLFLGIVLLIAYSSLLIAYGRFPKIPILSDAAKLQVQQG